MAIPDIVLDLCSEITWVVEVEGGGTVEVQAFSKSEALAKVPNSTSAKPK